MTKHEYVWIVYSGRLIIGAYSTNEAAKDHVDFIRGGRPDVGIIRLRIQDSYDKDAARYAIGGQG